MLLLIFLTDKPKLIPFASCCSLTWLVFVLASFVGLFSLFIELSTEYFEYPTYTWTTIKHSHELQFPAVTMCNLSTRNKSRLPDSARDEFWRELTKVNWSEPEYQNHLYHVPRTEADIIDESMDFNQTFLYGTFDRREINTSTEVTPIITRHGLCFMWNKDGKASMKTKVYGVLMNLRVWIKINSLFYSWNFDTSTGIRVGILVVLGHLFFNKKINL